MPDSLRNLFVLAALALCAGCKFEEPIELSPPVYQSTASGVHFVDLLPGEGKAARTGDRVALHYVGRLEGGEMFDDSRDRGAPLAFVLGSATVLPAWEEALVGMRAGGRRELTIPPHLAYGDEGLPGVIPPGATLVLDVELLEVGPADGAEPHP